MRPALPVLPSPNGPIVRRPWRRRHPLDVVISARSASSQGAASGQRLGTRVRGTAGIHPRWTSVQRTGARGPRRPSGRSANKTRRGRQPHRSRHGPGRVDPRTGARWTDNGTVRQRRELKHRPPGETRVVPVHPELVALLRIWHRDPRTGTQRRIQPPATRARKIMTEPGSSQFRVRFRWW
jgi:hypothetical protein